MNTVTDEQKRILELLRPQTFMMGAGGPDGVTLSGADALEGEAKRLKEFNAAIWKTIGCAATEMRSREGSDGQNG